MKKIVSYITLLVFVMQLVAGCKSTTTSKKPTSPSIDSQRLTSSTTDERKSNEQDSEKSVKLRLNLPVAIVDIMDYEVSTQPRGILMRATVTWADGSIADRKLTIRHEASNLFDTGTRLSLTDDADNLLFEYVLEQDTTEVEFSITERTQSDEMTMTYSFGPGTVKESYNINGAYKEFTYPVISEEQMRATLDFYNSYEKRGTVSKMAPSANIDLSQEYLAALESFDQFYSPSLSNTLHNNQQAELLTYFMTNEDFVTWLEQVLSPPGSSKTAIDRKTICALIHLCSLLKCTFSPGYNPVCDACLVGSLVCVMLDLFKKQS